MSSFEEILQDYFHKISIAPNEPRKYSGEFSDTVLHLPVLEYYASKCKHVTEFGVRDGCSTVAFLNGCKDGEVHSYDIDKTNIIDKLNRCSFPAKSWYFKQQNTIAEGFEIDETDMIYFDTLHTYEHLSKELQKHGRKARQYLAFHDTFTCGEKDLSGPNREAEGIGRAIREFCEKYTREQECFGGIKEVREYEVVYETKWNNGLLILERIY